MLFNVKLDKNNIESGIELPYELRYYVNKTEYVHKYGIIAMSLKTKNILLSN